MSVSSRRIGAAAALALTAAGFGLAVAAPAQAAPPANDNFTFAQFLPGANNSISGRTDSATAELGEPKHAGQAAHASVWYRWTAPATGHAIFRTQGSNFDTVLSVYQGNSLGGVVLVADNDDTTFASDGSTRQSQVRFAVTAGSEYKIAIDGFGTASGQTKLTWTTNDDFAAAQVLPGPSGAFQTAGVHNDGATAEVGEPAHAGSAAARSVWYRWTAPSTGIATFDAVQGNYDTRLAVYTGNSVNALTLVTQNDNPSATNNRAHVVFAATAGKTYNVALDGVSGQQGFEIVRYSLVAPAFRIGDITVAEGQSGTKNVTIGVSRNTQAPAEVSVKVATKDGTALAPGDYTAASTTVTFGPTELTKQVTLQIKGDTVKEPTENLSVNLSQPTGGFAIADGTGVVTISNDD